MELYKVWIQNEPNSTIYDLNVKIKFVTMNHFERVGIMKLYHIFERNFDDQKRRIKIKHIQANALEIRKPTSTRIDYFRGIFPINSKDTEINDIRKYVPEKYLVPPYILYALIKTPNRDKYYVVTLKSIDEVKGFQLLIFWLDLKEDEIIVRVENEFGKEIEYGEMEERLSEINA